MPFAIRTVTESGPLTTSDYCVLADATAGPITLTFPPVAGLSGDNIMVKKIDATANPVTIAVIDAAPIVGDPVLVADGDRAVFATDGAKWHIVQRLVTGAYASASTGTLATTALQPNSSLPAANLSGTIALARLGSGSALQVARRNAGNDALEFVTLAGGGDMLAANNLSDVLVPATARTNLGLGTAATTNSTAYATAAQGATADLAAVASTTTAALALKADLAAPTFTGVLAAATVTASGAVTGSNLSGTNTGDNATNSQYSGLVTNANHTGDVTGSTALTLATAQPDVHTWALAQTFTVAPVFTDASGSRTALGLGTLATQSGTFSGTSSGTNTGDQTNVTGSAASLSISGQSGLLTVTGLVSTNRIKTVRDAADTLLELGGNYTPTGTWTNLTLVTPTLGTPASGNGSNLTALNGTNVASGTVADGRIATTLTGKTLTTAIVNNQSFLNNFSTASQAPTAATRTYITGSRVTVPVGKLQIGTLIRWTFDVTKTAAGTALSTFDICFGTAGTTADTARCSFTKPAGTGVVDNGKVVIECIIRGPLSASGIAVGHFNLTHNLSTTGLANLPCINVTTISGAFDVTVANLFVGVCITTGASDAYTIQQVITEVWNL